MLLAPIREIDEVLNGRTTEAVQSLVFVPDDAEVLVARGQPEKSGCSYRMMLCR